MKMMVEVKCKLTGIEITHYWWSRCVFLLPFLSSNHCCEKTKKQNPKKKRNRTFRKLLCFSFFFLLFSSLGRKRDYFVAYLFLLPKHTPINTRQTTLQEAEVAVSRLLKQEIELQVIPTAGITCYSISCFIAFPYCHF